MFQAECSVFFSVPLEMKLDRSDLGISGYELCRLNSSGSMGFGRVSTDVPFEKKLGSLLTQ